MCVEARQPSLREIWWECLNEHQKPFTKIVREVAAEWNMIVSATKLLRTLVKVGYK